MSFTINSVCRPHILIIPMLLLDIGPSAAAGQETITFDNLLQIFDEELSIIQKREKDSKEQEVTLLIDQVTLEATVGEEVIDETTIGFSISVPIVDSIADIGKIGAALEQVSESSSVRTLTINYSPKGILPVNAEPPRLGLSEAIQTLKTAIRHSMAITPYLHPDYVEFDASFAFIKDGTNNKIYLFVLDHSTEQKTKYVQRVHVEMSVLRRNL